ncbi:MAG: hypothetical protein ACP5I1_16420 [Candidatus Hinthialibacter sp.]
MSWSIYVLRRTIFYYNQSVDVLDGDITPPSGANITLPAFYDRSH